MKENTPLTAPLDDHGFSHAIRELRKSSSIHITDSADEGSLPPVFKVWVDNAMESLLEQEDTDKNLQITILDNGPKVVSLGTFLSDGGRTREIRGTYLLANLLEELHLTKGRLASKMIHFHCVSKNRYFACLGLLELGRLDLVRDILYNFIFQVKHYGKIPNANRSYYLCRSQPPFLSDLAVRTFKSIDNKEEAAAVLRAGILAAIKEYFTVWMSEPRYDPTTGLSRFKPPGKGIPLEVEEGHFDAVLYSYAEKYACTIPEFIDQYNFGNVNEPELDEYFMHDRGVRESGHDTSYRFDQGCADLATVDLNCLLYKYESDIAWAIKNVFNDKLPIPAEWRTPETHYLRIRNNPLPATGAASPAANKPTPSVTRALPKFECVGGLSNQLVYRWLQLMVRVAVNYHGAIVEKYDVTQLDNPSQVDAEYGNQGLDFKYANVEGHRKLMVKALGLCVPYDDLRMENAHI
ncbi:conserved hypothetical protein [Histoplasma mississippiense (nom. inval.)]|uniref:conserved hypothetical protein n=1 Tax=Ajellomyces capsulatus (strain NAm1 / WU24) TaxID=2059318 RepID=UPI000157CA32|nr:conserved hypothetical protein [Histoplasma mississippiense (nom. inval.)]EDN09075.1 conserved hypothetical protein [Histoplasma mississippiense (nom. inval.)]